MNSFWLPLRPARLSLAPGRFTGKINMGIRKQELGSHGNPEMDGLAPQGNSGSTAVLTAGTPQQGHLSSPSGGPGSTLLLWIPPTRPSLSVPPIFLASASSWLIPPCVHHASGFSCLPPLWVCGPWSFPKIFSTTYIQPFHRERTWYFHLIAIHPVLPNFSSRSSCQPLASLQMSTNTLLWSSDKNEMGGSQDMRGAISTERILKFYVTCYHCLPC